MQLIMSLKLHWFIYFLCMQFPLQHALIQLSHWYGFSFVWVRSLGMRLWVSHWNGFSLVWVLNDVLHCYDFSLVWVLWHQARLKLQSLYFQLWALLSEFLRITLYPKSDQWAGTSTITITSLSFSWVKLNPRRSQHTTLTCISLTSPQIPRVPIYTTCCTVNPLQLALVLNISLIPRSSAESKRPP